VTKEKKGSFPQLKKRNEDRLRGRTPVHGTIERKRGDRQEGQKAVGVSGGSGPGQRGREKSE